jgi:hypothetical protein
MFHPDELEDSLVHEATWDNILAKVRGHLDIYTPDPDELHDNV